MLSLCVKGCVDSTSDQVGVKGLGATPNPVAPKAYLFRGGILT